MNIEELIKSKVELKPLTTMKTGGPAKFLAEPSTSNEILACLDFARDNSLEVFILGAGSNIIVDDDGFDGLVIRLNKEFSNIAVYDDSDEEYICISAKAGCPLSKLGNEAADLGLEGAEFACGIPGTVGGAVFMNAGAYGREIKDIATSIEYIEDGIIKTIDCEDAQFGYRTSLFKKLADEGKNIVITNLTIKLHKGDREKVMAYVKELREKRVNSQPLTVPSAGSTFKRPEGYFAGKLIEDSGLRGFCLDDSGAQVSPKHCGFIVNNNGTCGSKDLKKLINYVQNKVYEDSGVHLECEVRFIGGMEA